MNSNHCRVSSGTSRQAKLDHYRLKDAFDEGVLAASEVPICQLTPVKYYNKDELADQWNEGFKAGLLKNKKAAL